MRPIEPYVLRTAHRFPGHTRPRHAQDGSGISKGVCLLEPVGFRHATVLQREERILHHAQSDFVVHFLGLEAGCAFFDQKAFYMVVGHITRPDDGYVTECGVADPFLLPVEHPTVPVAASVHV